MKNDKANFKKLFPDLSEEELEEAHHHWSAFAETLLRIHKRNEEDKKNSFRG